MRSTLLLGGSGRLGRSIQVELKKNEIPFLSPTRNELNICDFDAVQSFISIHRIERIIHAASILTPRTASDVEAQNDSEISRRMDKNVLQLVEDRNLQLFYFSTALIYPLRNMHFWSEKDFGAIPYPPLARRHYAMVKYESTGKILTLASQGVNCSAIVLPNLLAGPIPTSDRNDQLCEKLLNLSRNATSSGKQNLIFNIEVNPNLQLVAGLEIAKWLSFVVSHNFSLPPILNLASNDITTPIELLQEIIKQKFPELPLLAEGEPKQSLSYLLSDSIARQEFLWRGGESLSRSVDMWISDPAISNQVFLSS
jgi:nucleoside-diphosphate-sugar epimerase